MTKRWANKFSSRLLKTDRWPRSCCSQPACACDMPHVSMSMAPRHWHTSRRAFIASEQSSGTALMVAEIQLSNLRSDEKADGEAVWHPARAEILEDGPTC